MPPISALSRPYTFNASGVPGVAGQAGGMRDGGRVRCIGALATTLVRSR